MTIKTIGVVGAGQMGNGIAQVCAVAGFPVIMQDISQDRVDTGVATITGSLDRMIKKEKITEDNKTAALALINTTTDITDLAEVDVVIEAATENEALKLKIFEQLDKACKADAILASNTSSISLTRIAAVTQRDHKVIGMHFMNPVPMMALVEIIRALQSSDETYQAIHDLSEAIGKVPVEAKDSPGFVGNRILVPMINEAAFVLYEGLADAEGIDTIMKLGMNHPMGPLMLADLVGLDTCLSVTKILHEGFGDSKYRPCPLMQQMVDAGYLGRKSGRGFYKYDD
ncbi:MAG: 3-hydroxybutyryl-CoA dehydrogenase [Gammaproteobacteria bacterium]|jgi:3-hydroxybutyryl-CoA dehydrogenase